MKNLIIIVALATALLASCKKEEAPVADVAETAEDAVEAPDTDTDAAEAPAEVSPAAAVTPDAV